MSMLKRIRIGAAVVFWLGITLLFLDFTGVLHRYLGWMAKVQFLPAVLALNVGVIAALVLLTLVFGRVYCSVICPLGVFQDGISWLGTRKSKAPYKYKKELRWLRYGIWVAYVACLVAGVQVVVSLLAPYGAYGRIISSIKHPVAGPTIIIAAVTLIAVVALSLKGGRTYCNSICPVGTTLSFFSRFAMFRPVIDADKCKHCKACEHACKAQCIAISKDEQKIDYSRCVDCFNCLETCKFGALNYKFAWKKQIPGQSGNEGADKSRRAFGSKSVKDFYRHCIACQLCVVECPNNVLRPSSDPERLMQPEMGYENGFCRPECTRCSEVCPAGAIEKISREEKTQYHIGTAHVDLQACISATGKTHCGKCASKCPVGAIHMVKTETGMAPAVNEEVCIGCGACEQYCPVRPISAITVNGKYQHV